MAVLDACLRELDASNPVMKIKDNLHPLVPHTKHRLGLHLSRE